MRGGDGEALKLGEIEVLASHFKMCPECSSKEGFWLGVKRDHAYVQCKACGTRFELFEALPLAESKKPSWKARFLKR